MNKNPEVSVIMPVYNAELYLDAAIKSILKQTYENFEFIIINDGSSDKSLEIIKKYKDKRIVLISRENKGIISSLNEGIESAKGKYLARMDADDISLPHRLEKQVEFIEQNKLDVCGGDFIIINHLEKEIGSGIMPKKLDEIVLTLGFNVPFAHPSVLIRKDFLIKNNISYGKNGKKFAEDLDMWLCMFNQGAKFGNLNQKILLYRILPQSLTRVNSKKISKEIENQFQNFVRNNYQLYVNSLENKLKQNELNRHEQKIVLRALLSCRRINFNFSLHKKVLMKVNIINLIFILFSEVKKRIK